MLGANACRKFVSGNAHFAALPEWPMSVEIAGLITLYIYTQSV